MPARIILTCASVSECGLVRSDNQDTVLCDPENGVLCVADGMGGGEGGALASGWICKSLAAVCGTGAAARTITRRKTLVGEALCRVNTRIRAYARAAKFKIMGSTVTALLFNPRMPARALICHVGDSRMYRLRAGKLLQLTHDHTISTEFARALPENDPQAQTLLSRRNPLSHILTRAIGTEQEPRPDWREAEIRPGDIHLLCTDGVHDLLSDAEIGKILCAEPDPKRCLDILSNRIIAAGAHDNYSIVYCAAVAAL